MHPDIERLVELQALDTRLADLRGRLASFPRQLAAVEARVSEARNALAAAKDALTASLKERKTYEMDAEGWREKARKYRAQSFEVKTNEAYKAIQHEIEHAEAEAAQAEDRLLERMVAGEEFERQVKTAERALAEAERAAAAERGRLQAEQSAAQKELESVEAERRRAASAVQADLLDTYERIAARRHGIAVAEVRDEACALCGVRVRPHVFQELRRPGSMEIFQCESCTRILYYAEPRNAGAAVAPAGGNAGPGAAAAGEG